MQVKIHESWKEVLEEVFQTEEFKKLAEKVKKAYIKNNPPVYPKPNDLFAAFNKTPFDKIKVVIIGQDPYHNPNQAHGLAFSVPKGAKAPPSLQNIFKEICDEIPNSASCIMSEKEKVDLTRWAKQGVLLLNAILTVYKNLPASHKNLGWEKFTDKVIEKISDNKENVVFMLWGNFARSKKTLIDSKKHLILEAAHPSPFSADKGFFGCNHFVKANKYLKQNNKKPINW